MGIFNSYWRFFRDKPVISCYNGFKITDKSCLDVNHIVVLDTETTGTDAVGLDEIIQVGAVWRQDDSELNIIQNKQTDLNTDNFKLYTLNYFVQPLFHNQKELINNFIKLDQQNALGDLDINHQINLINNAFNSKNTMKDLAYKLKEVVQDKVVVMYNGTYFDACLINKLFGAFNLQVSWACLDAMVLTYHLGYEPKYNNFLSYKQKAVGNSFEIENEDSHDALGDCKQLFKIYEFLYNKNIKKEEKDEKDENEKNVSYETDFFKIINKYQFHSELVNRVCVFEYVKTKPKIANVIFFNYQITSYLVHEELKAGKKINDIVKTYIYNSNELKDLQEVLRKQERKDKKE